MRHGMSTRGRRRLIAAASCCLALAVLPLVGGCLAPKRVGDGRPSGPPPAPRVDEPVLLRVGLGEGLGKQRFACTGSWQLRSGASGQPIVDLAAGDTASAWCFSRKVMYGCNLQGGIVSWLAMAPQDPDDVLVWDGRAWRGELHVIMTPADSSHVTVINVVDLERYLAGVVPGEIGRGLSAEARAAVAAQAIAARTYAVSRLDAQRDRGFDLFADTRDQVYGGAGFEDPLADAAIAETAGLVLYREEALAACYFHSTCGGHTAAIQEVWPVAADPLLCGVADARPDGRPWCADGRWAQWREEWSWSELEQVLAVSLPAYLDDLAQPARAAWRDDAFQPAAGGADSRRPGALRGLAVTARTREGRVAVLEITTAAGRYRVRGDQTRRVLRPTATGSQLLRSAWFDLDVDQGRRVTASGRGWGHGLGLCQVGALARARAGQDVRAILAHYYPGSRLAPLGAAALP